jgi:hypothetical protein
VREERAAMALDDRLERPLVADARQRDEPVVGLGAQDSKRGGRHRALTSGTRLEGAPLR